MNDDTISRAAALDALGERPVVWSDNDDYTLGERNQYDMDRLAIETVPSAQLAQDLTKGCTDTISRQAVLNLIEQSCCDLEYDCDNVALRKEVEALPSAQPVVISKSENTTECEDAVSRTEAVEALYDWEQMYTWDEHCKEDGGESPYIVSPSSIIEKLPSVTPPPQPGWIPWDSGKFPEEAGTYTVTAYDGATKRVTYAKYQKRLKRWELTGARAYWKVLAWMPHIEPWEGGQDG